MKQSEALAIIALIEEDKTRQNMLVNSPGLLALLTAVNKTGATIPAHIEPYRWALRYREYAQDLEVVVAYFAEGGVVFETNPDFYRRVFENASMAKQLVAVLHYVKEHKIRLSDPIATYTQLKNLSRRQTPIIEYFKAGKELETTLGRHAALYRELMEQAQPKDYYRIHDAVSNKRYDVTNLIGLFSVLSACSTSVQEHRSVYIEALYHAHDAQNFLPIFSLMKDLPWANKVKMELYLKVLQHPDADKLVILFTMIRKSVLSLQDCCELFVAILEERYGLDNFIAAFETLGSMGVSLTEYTEIYLQTIKNRDTPEVLEGIFRFLKTLGAGFKEDKALYLHFMKHYLKASAEEERIVKEMRALQFEDHICRYDPYKDIKKTLENLKLLGFGYTANKELYRSIMEIPASSSSQIIGQLKGLGIKSNSHAYILAIFFLKKDNTPIQYSPSAYAQLVNQLKRFISNNPLLSKENAGYEAQCTALQKELMDVIEAEKILTEGPLNKSSDTRELERILQKIAVTRVDELSMTFDETHGYVLAFQDEQVLFINHLLTQVNFNHLDLDREVIEGLGKTMQQITGNFEAVGTFDRDNIASQLPPSAQKALQCYIGKTKQEDRRYININRLFRGLAPANDPSCVWIKPVDGTGNLLANFICACLVNWSAKALPLALLDTSQGQIPATRLGTLDRVEYIDPAQRETIARGRIANPVLTPSVTSVSASKEGLVHALDDPTPTKFECTTSTRPVITADESEQLIPHGTAFIYTLNPQGGFFAREVNSPSIAPTGFYWTAVALSYAYSQHLKLAYKETPQDVALVNGKVTNRPNHALAHTYRVMTYVPVVVNYFARHAQDEAFRLFCIYMPDNELQWLMAAAAFRVTGRESEIAAAQNPMRYEQFKKASQAHFIAFLQVHIPPQTDEGMQERMAHLIRYLGNPAYEQPIHNQPAVNQHQNTTEQAHRNFLYRILTVAHALDLARCYTPEQVEKALSFCTSLTRSSSQQALDFQAMERFAIELIKAHGDSLCTDITCDGMLVPCNRTYQSPFERVSHSMRELQFISATVTCPQLAEKYQVEHESNPDLLKEIFSMFGVNGLNHPEA